jgi:hypothetical protein
LSVEKAKGLKNKGINSFPSFLLLSRCLFNALPQNISYKVGALLKTTRQYKLQKLRKPRSLVLLSLTKTRATWRLFGIIKLKLKRYMLFFWKIQPNQKTVRQHKLNKTSSIFCLVRPLSLRKQHPCQG